MAADIGQIESDALLDQTEREVIKVYRRAAKESEQKLEDYLKEFAADDEAMLAKLEKGEITEDTYTKWRKDTMVKGKRFDEMLNTLSTDLTNSDKIAMSIVNGYLPEAYAINRNFAAFEVEKGSLIDTSFTLYDRRTVERLIKDKSVMLPKPRVDVPKDKRWNKRHIREEITQGVLQGESIPAIAKRLENVVGMDKAAALRNARTAMTGAQSLGRTDEYKRAQEMGIDLMQEWRASLDGLTRHSHRMLDGEKVNVGEVFPNGCRYPGDPEGEPSEVYNCRCYIKAFLTGFDFADGKRLNRLGGMSYEEWKTEKEHKQDKQFQSSNPVDGKDISSTWKRRSEKFDFEIEDVINAQGFDGLPKIVSKEDFDKAVEESGYIAQRIYSAKDEETLNLYRKSLYSGKWHVDCSTNGSLFGQGMYCVGDYSKEVTDNIKFDIKKYSDINAKRGSTSSYIETLTLTPDAKRIKYTEACRMYARELVASGVGDEDDLFESILDGERSFNSVKLDDIGVWAAKKGYDALERYNRDVKSYYTVVLNRTKCIFLGE